ncbi:hypothetical protein [uncultured Photobacterium sp.]|uniref:hypothetical protein n=1 Tax=uncultured Photobacterium sp. TaxID=173973 RepID=UPI00262E15EF|nr:hypothetical protein [uncultured Photobacterium sp.]
MNGAGEYQGYWCSFGNKHIKQTYFMTTARSSNKAVNPTGWLFNLNEQEFLQIGGSRDQDITGFCEEKGEYYYGGFELHLRSIYVDDEVKNLVLGLSGTTVFLPALIARSINTGWSVIGESTWMRVCSTELHGPGDIIEFQGKRWIVFPSHAPGDIGYAFLLG